MTDSSANLVITGCTALVHDDEEGVGFLEDATIVVRDGVIEAVVSGPAASAAGREGGGGSRTTTPEQHSG